MKLAIITDIHGNELALKAVLQEIDKRGDVSEIWCLGDMIAMGPDSNEVLDILFGRSDIRIITGNHDEFLRKFENISLGNLQIVNQITLKTGDTKTWIFHGDVFDVTMKHSKFLAKLGATGYDLLILINRFANFISEKILKKGKLSLSKKIKNSVKSAIKFINDFEQKAIDIAA